MCDTAWFNKDERLVLLGLCFPSSCTGEDITKMLTYQFNNSSVSGNSQLTVVRVRPVPGSYMLLEDKKFLAFGGSILVIVFLMFVGTVTEFGINYRRKDENKKKSKGTDANHSENPSDVENNNGKKNSIEITGKSNVYKVTEKEILEYQKNGKAKLDDSKTEPERKEPTRHRAFEILLAFSVMSNSSKILTCSRTSEDSLNSVHGLRFLSLAWVVLVHTYLQIFAIGENKGLRALTEKKFIYQLVGNATYSVDSFFIISGLLVSYLYFKVSRRDNHVNGFFKIVGKFTTLILYRFIRLTPVYIVVIGMVHFTTAFLKDTSVFETPLIVQLNCDKYWWRNILYVNNFFTYREMCMLWSWYMAADTQFFVLSAFVLVIAKRYFKTSVSMLFALLISSWCTTAYIAYINQFQVKVQEPLTLFDELYDKPWTRIGPYIVGLFAGWLLCEKNCKLSIPLPLVLLGWIFSLGGLVGLVFCVGSGFGVAESSIYAALGHTAWGLCLAWIVVACRCGYGGWINSLLSWPAFLPFSRLTYCAYLVHPVIMFLTNYVMDGPFHMHNGVVVIIFLGNLISSYLLSFILSITFEAPFVRLLKFAISPQVKR
ncbi:hypothetical protein RUM43_013843 [Polyplax serrata]|uniref:Acyltransferase 3 domain-containing protein n=1 Tax=Polyplax serrata TaxID=468196 RepID=A0AAN8P1J6_POLSC